LGKKGGRNRLKRLAAPRLWDIHRKEKRFVVKPSPGPYPIETGYSLAVAVRDLLHIADNYREVRYSLSQGDVLVDGVARRDPAFPVGLFNVIEVPKEGTAFRLIPSPDGLAARKVPKEETRLKLCRVRSKVKIEGGRIQYGFHDGRSLIKDDLSLAPGDSVVMKVPEQGVLSSVKLAKGTLGLVISGERAGQLGKISEVKKGTVTREKMVTISLPTGETELPARLVFPVGSDKPAIGVQVAA
jgi:small subunit ribosomal protein S4e